LNIPGIPGVAPKIAPIVVAGFAGTFVVGACFRFMFISSVPVVQSELAFNGAYWTSVRSANDVRLYKIDRFSVPSR
jgi:hypothetical protein